MQRPTFKSATLGGGPIANALVILAAAIVIGVSLVLGFFAFVGLTALILVAGCVVAIRNWWYRRKVGATPGATAEEAPVRSSTDVIEGEFHVVKDDKNS